jgi:hypothetical protein
MTWSLKKRTSNQRFPVHPAVEQAKVEMLEAFTSGSDDYGLKHLRLKYLLALHHPETGRPMEQRKLSADHKAKISASKKEYWTRRRAAIGVRAS